jgi:2-dehydropantoate 2-reductase
MGEYLMKICIYGTGAVGAHLAVRLVLAGTDVTCIARGAHLEAIQKNGLKFISGGHEQVVKLRAVETPQQAGPQDYVIMALKAPSAVEVAAGMAPLLGPKTAVVTAQNGLPWWYFYKSGGAFDGRRLAAADPGGKQWDMIGPERAIGCVLYSAGAIAAPGVITHNGGKNFILGEPDGSVSKRAEILADILTSAGCISPVSTDIRTETWLKFWGNSAYNPISALTGATLDQIANDPDVRAITRRAMLEVKAVANALGVYLPIDVDKRIDMARQGVGHKTSMLQDIEAGRQMEIDALIGTVQELARLTAVPMPTLDTIAGLVRLEAEIAGCYRPA